LLAVAAGLADACSAVVTMAFSHVASHGPAALFTSWTVYAVVVCGAGNVLLTQTAYQTGRPMITLPVIAAVTPVASAAVGIGLLGEAPRTGVAGGVAAGLAVLVTSLALACLARSAPHPEPRGHGPADGEPSAGSLGLAGGILANPGPLLSRSERDACSIPARHRLQGPRAACPLLGGCPGIRA
jgi:hypothetical protein